LETNFSAALQEPILLTPQSSSQVSAVPSVPSTFGLSGPPPRTMDREHAYFFPHQMLTLRIQGWFFSEQNPVSFPEKRRGTERVK
jgi:hypothetical protein